MTITIFSDCVCLNRNEPPIHLPRRLNSRFIAVLKVFTIFAWVARLPRRSAITASAKAKNNTATMITISANCSGSIFFPFNVLFRRMHLISVQLIRTVEGMCE